MVTGRRAGAVAWAAAGVLFVGAAAAGCGDDGGGTEKPSPTTTTTRADQPADPAAAEKQVKQNWEKFFDPSVPNDEKTKLLENGDQLGPLLQAFNGDARARQVAAKVTKVSFTSATSADVTYTLTLRGATALPNASGTSVEQNKVWKVSVKALCALVQMSGNDVKAPGC
ncbi:hypothetical protein ABZW18_07840 [Streptomyces sp. NPDC004647]|uniref:hypothetical protein n=1 Tax=Streptomyces sp. NPDC004647 TaxID=3154671 RepID=UPI00339FCDDA